MNGNIFQTYQKMDIITADPRRLIIMCYEGAIQNLGVAKLHYLNENYEAKGKAIQKAVEIINTLREALDFEKGGEIAKNLDRIYDFFIRYILRADIKRDIKGLDQTLFLLGELKSAWERSLFGDLSSKRFLQAKNSNSPNPSGEEIPVG
jgi:flagellar protein FliS